MTAHMRRVRRSCLTLLYYLSLTCEIGDATAVSDYLRAWCMAVNNAADSKGLARHHPAWEVPEVRGAQVIAD
jgi:hypothetical protein